MTEVKPKGHWPKGKRRNPDPDGSWQATLLALTTLLDHHHQRGVVSIGALAGALGRDKKTVHKWILGVNRPAEDMQEAVATWIRKRRELLKKKPKGS